MAIVLCEVGLRLCSPIHLSIAYVHFPCIHVRHHFRQIDRLRNIRERVPSEPSCASPRHRAYSKRRKPEPSPMGPCLLFPLFYPSRFPHLYQRGSYQLYAESTQGCQCVETSQDAVLNAFTISIKIGAMHFFVF